MNFEDFEDLQNCPFLKDKFNDLTEEELLEMKNKYEKHIKPKLEEAKTKSKIKTSQNGKMKKSTKKGKEEEKKGSRNANESSKPEERKRHPRLKAFQEAQGSCPFLNQSNGKFFPF
jgi:hypothetical protein